MGDNYLKVKELILASDLPLDEQTDLLVALGQLDDGTLAPLLDATADPEMLRQLNENFRAKRAALRLDDADLLQQILQSEEQLLQS